MGKVINMFEWTSERQEIEERRREFEYLHEFGLLTEEEEKERERELDRLRILQLIQRSTRW